MSATNAYRKINNSPIRGIIIYYTENIISKLKGEPLGKVISEIQTGKTPPMSNPNYYSSLDFDWFKPSDIGYAKYLEVAKDKFSNIAIKDGKATIYPANTLLMIGIGGGVGRVSLLRNEGSSNQQITGISFNDKIYPEYAYYYYLVREDYIKSKAKSASFPILNQAKIKQLEIKYPSYKEQVEFCNFIENCNQSYEENTLPSINNFNVSVELKKYALKQFQSVELHSNISLNIKEEKDLIVKLKQSILQDAIQGKLTTQWRLQNKNVEPASNLLKRIKASKQKLITEGKLKKEKILPPINKNEIPFELPSSWVSVILDELVLFTNGKAHEQLVDANGKYVLVNSKFVSTNGAIRKYASELLCPLYKNDITIVMSDVPDGRALSRCFLVDKNETYTLNQRIGSLTSLEGVNQKYLQIVIDRNSYYLNFNDSKKQTNLKKDEILSCPIPLPPLEEQIAIVEKVELLMGKCIALQTEIITSETYAKQLMQAVLKEAFETKMEVV
jgi:type I restriction enzyme S subunit